jgi:hypothetical protein
MPDEAPVTMTTFPAMADRRFISMAFLSHLPRVPGFVDQDVISIVLLWVDFGSVRLACHLILTIARSGG